MTNVVHCKKEKYDVLIDRTTKWGNPFKISKTDPQIDRDFVIRQYEDLLVTMVEIGEVKKEDILELDGKTLGCWCSPKACHGDAIIRVINMIKWGVI